MPLRPNRIRYFLNFHNPDAMGYEFTDFGDGPGESIDLAILTNKVVRDLKGDVVFMVGRRSDRPGYYLYAKFRVAGHGRSDHEVFKQRVWGKGTQLKKPVALDGLAWGARLLKINPNLSQGFQGIRDKEVVTGMSQAFDTASKAQLGKRT